MPRFLVLLLIAAGAPALRAQAAFDFVTPEEIGAPPHPPFLSLIDIARQGDLVTSDRLPPKGPVAEIRFEGENADGAPGKTSRTLQFDSQGRLVRTASVNSLGTSTEVVVYQAGRKVSEESTGPKSGKSWNYWTYDSTGKLTEYRRGRDNKIQNHITDINRDASGRLVSYEYRQGEKDELALRDRFHYSSTGRVIDIESVNAKGEITQSLTETLDDDNHVIEAIVHEYDWRTKRLKPPLKVTFRYDPKGRLIEQDAALHEVEAEGAEQEIPPGKIVIAYDDKMRTKETRYGTPDGLFASKLTLNQAGATVAVDLTGGAAVLGASMKMNCKYDRYGNWTSCEQISNSEGNTQVTESWKRTITYR